MTTSIHDHFLSDADLQVLNQEFPEGVPAWMTERGYSVDDIRKLMNLRRKAFPKTVRS